MVSTMPSTLVSYTILLLFLFVSLASPSADAQAPLLKFKHITDDNGLSNTSVEAIFQDKRGFMWIGTRNGLNRYDGYDIRTFFHNSSEENSLSDNYIKCIYEDRQQNLWIGTANGLNRYDQARQAFVDYQFKAPAVPAFNINDINCLFEADENQLWVGTMGGGVYEVNRKDNTCQRLAFFPNQQANGAPVLVYDIARGRNGTVWIATNMGICQWDKANRKLINYPYRSTKTGQYASIHKIQLNADNNLWLGTLTSGLLFFDTGKKTFRAYTHNDKDPNSLGNDDVTSVLIDRQQNLWVGGINGGLNRFNPKIDSFFNYERQPENPSSLSQKSVKSIFEDRQGNLWVGTLRGGVNLYVPTAEKFKLYRQGLAKNTLSYNDIRAFCEDRRGNLWVGADGGGLNLFDRKTGTFRPYRYNPNDPRSLGSDAVMSISEDRRGNIWVATWGGGLNLFDPQTNMFRRFMNDPKNPATISSNFVQRAFEDSKGTLWVATYTGGLNVFDLTTNRFRRVIEDPSGKTKFTATKLIAINEDHDQNLWICTEDGGLNRYNLQTNTFTQYFNEPNVKQDLVVIFTDHQHRLWVGKKGLYQYDKASDRFQLFTKGGGLDREFIKGILEDRQGNLWITSSNGLTWLNPENQSFKKFNTRDGLQGLEFEDNSCLMTRDGEMYVGGVNGFNTFYPEKISSNRFIPPVHITDFQISNKPVDIHQSDSPLKKDISFTDDIRLRYDQSTFSFTFSALNFVVPEHNQYAYQLGGLDDRWVTAGTERRASYTNLRPGDYTFRVKASNNDGLWNNQPTAIRIIVTPPFWATWWFQTLVLLIIVGGVIAFFEFRRKLQLKAFEEKKRNELYQLQLQFFTNISHEFRTPLSLILGPLERIRSLNADGEFTHYYQTIQRNASRLMNLINELMDFRKVESGSLKLKVKPNDLLAFLTPIIGEFADLPTQKKLTFEVKDSADYKQVWFDSNILEKIILNLLNNSFKYTDENGVISVEVFSSLTDFTPSFANELIVKESKQAKHYAYIRIADNGIGVSKESISHLFERYYRISSAHLGSGIGLAFVKSLTSLHKGDIYVYSERSQGTEIIIGIPAGSSSYDASEKQSGVVVDGGIGLESGTMPIFQQERESPKRKPVPSHPPTGLQRESILIVDDNAELREFLRDALQAKYQVYEAEDGADGLEMAKQVFPNLIISDVMMPGINGVEFCKRIKNAFETSHIPFVMLTARDSLEAKIEGVGSGADVYLSKPISVDLLMLTIRNIFEQKKNLKERYVSDYYAEARGLVSSERDKDFLDKLHQLIDANLTNANLDVDFLVSEIGVSKTRLYQKIKNITGQSIAEFIRTFRLKKSVQIMTHEDVSLGEVSFRVGFQDPSYFSRVFKKEFGKSPSQFLESLRQS